MIRTKEMHATGLYLFSGKSSANSSFIEDKEEAMKFITSCNKKLDGYLLIHDFLICKDGWQLIVELKDENAIVALYNKRRKNSRRAKKNSGLKIAWKIISEQMRGILSNFVVYSNKKNGRTGSKVAGSYERSSFESLEEAKQHLDRMRRQLINMSQRLRKYRPQKTHFRISDSRGKGAIFLCSLNIDVGVEGELFGEGCISLLKNNLDVLRSLVNTTIRMHLNNKNPLFSPKTE